MRGWLIDIYPEYESNSIIYWVKTRNGARRFVDRVFLPQMFVDSTREKLDDLERALPILSAVKSADRVMKRTWLGEKEREVLAITIRDYSKVEDVAHTIDNRGRYKDYSLFNVDLRFSQRYFVDKDLFPMGLLEFRPKPRMLDDPYKIDYELPPLKGVELKIFPEAKRGIPTFEDSLRAAKVGNESLDGPEESMVRGIEDILREEDPDVIYTVDGDSFVLPYLYERAKHLGLPRPQLGRDKDDHSREKKGKSYFSYGRI